jgi:outer membrane protein insertion porin family
MKRALIALFLLLPPLVPAQPATPSAQTGSFRLVSVHATGSRHFSEAEIIAATGLKTGESITPEQLRPIADALAAGGAFEEVSYKFGPARNGISVQFMVKDAPEFVQTTFDNFVWFTDQQLRDAVRARVPLFHGEVPSDGEMTNQVVEALQSLLASRGIPGQVRFQLAQQNLGAPIEIGAFSIEGVSIRIRDLTFPGADATQVPALEAAGRRLLELPYQRATTTGYIELNLRPVYLEHGYLKAQFGQPAVTLVVDSPSEPVVSLAIPVTAGPQYRLGAVLWSGNKAIASKELDRLVKTKPGEPANLVQMHRDLEAVHALYVKSGYLRQTAREIPRFDESIQMATFEVQVSEEGQYKFASLSLTGLEPQVRDLVREEWKMREGEPYDPGYIKTFLSAALPLMKKGAVTKVEQDINDADNTVEVSVHFDFQEPIKEPPTPVSPGNKPSGRKPGK